MKSGVADRIRAEYSRRIISKLCDELTDLAQEFASSPERKLEELDEFVAEAMAMLNLIDDHIGYLTIVREPVGSATPTTVEPER